MMAVVTSATLLLKPEKVLHARSGALSPSGRMRPYDVSADGFVSGECAVSIVLEANRQQRHVYSKVCGSGTNQTSALLPLGYTSADMIGLSASLALSVAGLDQRHVACCHMHAMVTQPICPNTLSWLVVWCAWCL